MKVEGRLFQERKQNSERRWLWSKYIIYLYENVRMKTIPCKKRKKWVKEYWIDNWMKDEINELKISACFYGTFVIDIINYY
jgi:hypothetical protein